MPTISTAYEVDRLAHELAFDSAVSLIDSYSVPITAENGESWHDISSSSELLEHDNPLEAELRYLDLRGALVRHSACSMWIQIGEPNDA